jgi:hypothetical protein
VHDRQQRFSEQWKTAATGLSVRRSSAGPTKRVNRDDDECRRSDQRDAQHGAAGTMSGVAKAEQRDAPPANATDRFAVPALQPRCQVANARDEQHDAGAEERGHLRY